MSAPIVLVTMPWGSIQFPSIQLGTLKSVLRRGGQEAQVPYLNLKFAEFVIDETAKAAQASGEEPDLDPEDLLKLGDNPRLGDWVFAVPPFRAPDDDADQAFAPGAGDEPAGERTVARLRRLRALAPAFLQACLEDIVALILGSSGLRAASARTSHRSLSHNGSKRAYQRRRSCLAERTAMVRWRRCTACFRGSTSSCAVKPSAW